MWIALTVFWPHWVCPIQGCLCFHRLHCSGSQLLYMERALCRVRFQFSGPHKSADSVAPAFCVFPGLSSSGSQRLGHPLPGCGMPFSLHGPSVCHRRGLRKSLDRNRGPVCSVGEGGFSGAEFALFPSPLPPTSRGDGRLFSGVSQSPCFANRQQCVQAS